MTYIDPDRLDREAFDSFGESSVEVRASSEEDRWLASALALVYDELRGVPSNSVVAEALGHAISARVLGRHSNIHAPTWSRVTPLRPDQVREACGLLSESLTKGTTVAEIASHLGLGTSRFAKAFRSAVGLPPYTFLMRQRVRLAEYLLKKTTLPLVKVASHCGFASQSHLTTQFRRFAGRTPGEFRRLAGGPVSS